MNTLLAPLNELADYEEAKTRLKKKRGMIELNGCIRS